MDASGGFQLAKDPDHHGVGILEHMSQQTERGKERVPDELGQWHCIKT